MIIMLNTKNGRRALEESDRRVTGVPALVSHMQKALSKPPLKKRPVSTGYLQDRRPPQS